MKWIDHEYTGKMHLLLLIALILLVTVAGSILIGDSGTRDMKFRALPRPIASEPLLITSAGQSTDSYVIKDMTNALMLDNYFIPMASVDQLEGMDSVVLIIGYSEMGLRLNELTFDDEVERVQDILDEIDQSDLSLITFYLRGEGMLNQENETLLTMAAYYSDYLIVVDENGEDKAFLNIANRAGIPVTVVDSIKEVSEPYVSVFR